MLTQKRLPNSRTARSALSLLALVLTVLLQCNAATARTVEKLTTPNGFPFQYVNMPESEQTAFWISWESDYRFRSPTSATPLIGTKLMLQGGTTENSGTEMAAALSELTASANLWSAPSGTRGMLLAPSKNLLQASKLAAEVITKPALDARWLKRVAIAMKRNSAQRTERDIWHAFETARGLILGKTPFRDSVSLRTPELIEEVTLADLKQWHAETFQSAKMKVFVAGSANATDVGKALDDFVSQIPEGKQSSIASRETKPVPPKTIVIERPESKKATLLLIGSLPTTEKWGEAEDLVIFNVLSAGLTSRFFTGIRTKLGATYGIGAGKVFYGAENLLLRISGEVELGREEEILKAIGQIYDDLRADGITQQELERAVNAIVANTKKQLPFPAFQAEMLWSADFDGKPLQRAVSLIHETEAVDLTSVKKRLQTGYPQSTDLMKIIVTPKKDTLPAACHAETYAKAEELCM